MAFPRHLVSCGQSRGRRSVLSKHSVVHRCHAPQKCRTSSRSRASSRFVPNITTTRMVPSFYHFVTIRSEGSCVELAVNVFADLFSEHELVLDKAQFDGAGSLNSTVTTGRFVFSILTSQSEYGLPQKFQELHFTFHTNFWRHQQQTLKTRRKCDIHPNEVGSSLIQS